MKLRHAVGQIIRELRLEREWTMRALAEKSAVSLTFISEVERGTKEASSEVLQCLASGLEVPLSQIVIEAGYRLAGVNSFEVPQSELDKLLSIH